MARDLMPFLAMVILQVGYAGMNILSKLAMDSGMKPFIHVAYRQIFATIVIAPFAYFVERKTRPIMTKYIFFQMFLSSMFGATFNQILYFVGLQHSTPTIACALSNLLPAVTFVLAVPVGLENAGIYTRAGKAKVFGTIICVGGAMFLSFYNGPEILGDSGIHWNYLEDMRKGKSTTHSGFLGPFLVIASTISWAVWFIIQARVSEMYPAPYTTSALICFMASFECTIIGLAFNHEASAWSLTPYIRLVSCIYSGTVCTALAFSTMSWCIQRKGPLYVSVFSPLLLVVVAALSWALLSEKIYLGTVVGSVFIVLGLYAVLWGKNKEISTINIEEDKEDEDQEATKDLEIQFTELENGHTYNWEVQFSEVPNGSHRARI